MTVAHHCDREGCGQWQNKNQFPPFLEVYEGCKVLGHFCGVQCLTQWAAVKAQEVTA